MKLSEEFSEKFKGVMQGDNTVQVCEAVLDWLKKKEKQGEFRPLNARVSCNTDIMERLGLVEGSLKDSEEYQNLHVDTIKELIETCRDLYADYKMHHDPRIRKVLMKEGLMFPETEEELEIFEKHNPPEKGSCNISAEEMLNRIKQKET